MTCIICNNETPYKFYYLNYFSFPDIKDLQLGLCKEHNFIHMLEKFEFQSETEECDNNNHIHNHIEVTFLLMLIFSNEIKFKKRLFNSLCSDKIKETLIKLSYVSSELYYSFLKNLQTTISDPYKKQIIIDKNPDLDYCGLCDIWYTYENAIFIFHGKNYIEISKECGNCRKLYMNISKIIKSFDNVLNDYVKLIDDCGLYNDLNIIIANYLFNPN